MATGKEKRDSRFLHIVLSAGIHASNFLHHLIPGPHAPKKVFPLIEAIKRGDIEEVRALLAQGANPNERETQVVERKWLRTSVLDLPKEWAKTALMQAVMSGKKEIVELLLDSGAEVDTGDVHGSTALACTGNVEIAKLLIDRGADVNVRAFEPVLTAAAMEQRIDLMRLFLDNGADINATDSEGFTALMEPAGSGYMDVVETLLAAGIDVNVRNNEGFTAQHYAKENKQKGIVDMLVRAGAHE